MALDAIVGGTVGTVLDMIGSTATVAVGMPPVKEWLSGCKTRLVAGRSRPGNHDLVKGIRTAHLCAIDVVARRHAALIDQLPSREVGGDERPFSLNLRNFIDSRLKVLTSDGIDHDVLTVDDIDHALGDLVHPATAEGYAALASAARRRAIASALAQIEADAGRPSPPLFRAAFDGDTGPGWHSAFSVYVAEELKTNERFRSIFLAAELIDIKRTVAALDVRTREILGHFPELSSFCSDVRDTLAEVRTEIRSTRAIAGRTEDKLDKLIEALEASGMMQRAAVEGLERKTIFELARRLKPNEMLDLSQAITELEGAVAIALDVIAQGARGTNHDGFINEVLGRVARRTRSGEFDRASDEIDAALAELDRREREAHEELLRSRITLLESGIGQDVLRRNAEAVANRIEAISALTSPGERKTWSSEFIDRTNAFLVEGKSQARNFPLDVAAVLARRMLSETQTASEMGYANKILGDALRQLGRREFGTRRLEQCVAAYDAALKAYSHEDTAEEWASALYEATDALHQLGMREAGTATLERAVSAAQSVLEFRRIQGDPVNLGRSLCNVGATLQSLGERKDDPGLIEGAVAAYDEALEHLSRSDAPSEWALTHRNLGTLLHFLGKRESGTEKFWESVRKCQQALQEQSPDRDPFEWVSTQHTLASSFHVLGNRNGDPTLLKQAITHYREGLSKCSYDLNPAQWAGAQCDLGFALQSLGDRVRDRAVYAEAIQRFTEALRIYNRDNAPDQWAKLQRGLGDVASGLAEMERGTENVETALAAYRRALEATSRERDPQAWAILKHNMGIAQRIAGERRADVAELEAAVVSFEEALEERTRERDPVQWAWSQHNLGISLSAVGQRGTGTDRLEAAVAAFRLALGERSRERATYDGALTQHHLGVALVILFGRNENSEHLLEAISVFQEALEKRTRERSVLDWAQTQISLGSALVSLAASTEAAEKMEEAARLLEEALGAVVTTEQPALWAGGQLSLGMAFVCLGEAHRDIAMLDRGKQHLLEIVNAPAEGPVGDVQKTARDMLQLVESTRQEIAASLNATPAHRQSAPQSPPPPPSPVTPDGCGP